MLSIRRLFLAFILTIILLLFVACEPQDKNTAVESPTTPMGTLAPTGTDAPISPELPATATTAGFQPETTSTTSNPAGVSSPAIITVESPTPAHTATLAPKAWRTMPVIPASVSQRMDEVYQLGQSLGNNPQAFSKVGDCQTMLPDFLGDFDNGRYDLGEYAFLQPVVDFFAGSFGRNSRSVKDGLTASGVMATLWNTWKDCDLQETPLDCEYRINQPSFAFISLGTNDANGLLPFEDTLKRVIDVTLEHGIVPILVTKADNAEGDWSINATIAKLAYEYQIPLWNFWRAVQPLPNHGLRSPEHLTYGEYILPSDFSNPENMQYGYNVRNLTALQVLDVVWRAVNNQPAPTFVPTTSASLP